MNNPLDPLTLASLLASRLCHDLVNPVGALSAGLEVMEDEDDPMMKEEAQKLISVSTQKSIAMLTFARLAFGAGGAYGAEIDLDEAKIATAELYKYVKAELQWQLPSRHIAKDNVKAIMNIALVIADCVPRAGSTVTVTVGGSLEEVSFSAEGPRAKLKEQLVDALSGKTEGLEPKMTPAYLASVLVQKAGGTIRAELVNEEKVSVIATFPAQAEIAA
ncbi:MAG: histidine phosphotransferase family protein [Aquisalinus sp.]|nr:histidine phosphotransferase family protein [Aquisalinus sp.]